MTNKALKQIKRDYKAKNAQLRADIKARKAEIRLNKQAIKEAKAKFKALNAEAKTKRLSDHAKSLTATANAVNVKRIDKPAPTLFGFELTPFKRGK